MDVEDPIDARAVSIADMKHWEMAPGNPAALEKAGINFCLTVADLRDPKTFYSNLRKAIESGLSENKAMDALTKTPATLLGVYDKVGSLEPGKLANFIITSGPVFSEKTTILQNWVQRNLCTHHNWRRRNKQLYIGCKERHGRQCDRKRYTHRKIQSRRENGETQFWHTAYA
jgi:adenine deaminase